LVRTPSLFSPQNVVIKIPFQIFHTLILLINSCTSKHDMNHIKPLVFFSVFLFSINPQFAFAQSSSRFSFNKYIDKGDTLKYRQLYPDADNFRKYPLVIFLHGSGERGNDNEAQLKWA